MASVSERWPRRDFLSSRSSIFGFHPDVVVFGDLVAVAVAVADAATDVEDDVAGVEVESDGDNDPKENPWQLFAKRPTQQERKTRWKICFAVGIAMIILLSLNVRRVVCKLSCRSILQRNYRFLFYKWLALLRYSQKRIIVFS